MRVGFTGHRPNRLHLPGARISTRLREALTAVKDSVRARDTASAVVAVCALAEGADRLFADAALDLGYGLNALLPFASTEYETTFSDASTTAGYRGLLGRATRVAELPGALADAEQAYEAAGRAIVEQSDVLMTVWDGQPSAGRGGTPEIIEFALRCGRPVIWIHARQDRPPTQLISADPIIEDALAGLARAIGAAQGSSGAGA